ncbi:MAG: heparinase II/III family protein [Pirellulales bacterium]|nr:heparinase II/III family protein [Pirellulales bacterium]
MHRTLWAGCLFVAALPMTSSQARSAELIPPAAQIKTDRPRVLLRPGPTPHAISLAQLQAIPRDADFQRMLDQLREQPAASAQAMVWLLTDQRAAAEKAIAAMRAYEYPGSVDTFEVYFRLLEFALAYDWLYGYEGFTPSIKAEVRGRVRPLAEHGFRVSNDHVFHNYIWMSAGGTAVWALATAGEDEAADRLFEQIRRRFNTGLFPAMQYLDGLPSEPMGYWALYDLTPGVWTLLGAQSAFETDLVGKLRREQADWLDRHFDNLIHSTLPNMRYIPWGDLQSGPNGGVTYEMAGAIDAMTWALRSPHGAWFSRWLAERRGLRRFYGDTPVFYMLYTRNLNTEPATPPLSFLAGGPGGGHFIARSGFGDGDTVVALRCTDHYGDHNHYDQGGFAVYRNGLLAVDPPVYRRVGGPQQKTENHNTLLLGGQPQRPVRGQWFLTVEDFQKNLAGGRKLETGQILFHREAGPWAAVSCQFGQAYPPELVQSCVRQLLFVRPGTVVVVDRLAAPEGGSLPDVQWLLQLPDAPSREGNNLSVSNGRSWLRCRPLLPGGAAASVTATDVNTHRADYRYQADRTLTLVHLLEIGDGAAPGEAARVDVTRVEAARAVVGQTERRIDVTVDGRKFDFAAQSPFEVTSQ